MTRRWGMNTFVPEAAQPAAAAASPEDLGKRIELWKQHRESLITKLKSALDASVLQKHCKSFEKTFYIMNLERCKGMQIL